MHTARGLGLLARHFLLRQPQPALYTSLRSLKLGCFCARSLQQHKEGCFPAAGPPKPRPDTTEPHYRAPQKKKRPGSAQLPPRPRLPPAPGSPVRLLVPPRLPHHPGKEEQQMDEVSSEGAGNTCTLCTTKRSGTHPSRPPPHSASERRCAPASHIPAGRPLNGLPTRRPHHQRLCGRPGGEPRQPTGSALGPRVPAKPTALFAACTPFHFLEPTLC